MQFTESGYMKSKNTNPGERFEAINELRWNELWEQLKFSKNGMQINLNLEQNEQIICRVLQKGHFPKHS